MSLIRTSVPTLSVCKDCRSLTILGAQVSSSKSKISLCSVFRTVITPRVNFGLSKTPIFNVTVLGPRLYVNPLHFLPRFRQIFMPFFSLIENVQDVFEMELLHVKSPDIMSALATYIRKVRILLQQFYTPRKKVYSNSVEPVTKRSFGKVPNL